MTNRKSSVRDGIEKKVRNLSDRLRMKRRRKERRLLSETLETRQLLAGPELIGVQSNEGDLFRDFETQITNTLPTSVPELNVSPRELVFRFNDDAVISPESLQGITITRAGSDGFFEAANATTDLGTNGSVLVEFRSQTTGAAGNGTQIVFATSDRGPNGLPVITSVNASGIQPVITLNLNSATGRPATVADLVNAVNNTASVNQFISVQQVSGASLAKVGLSVDTSRSLTLTGANAAQALSDLGTNGAVRVRLTATETGSAGTGTQVIVKQRNFGGSALPLVLVSGNTVELQVNSTPGFETTIDQFLLAINSNEEASRLVTGSLEFGNGSTLMGNRTPTFSPLVLSGASDSVIQPGYVGLGDSPREVVFRFAETLPDDTYRIDINAAGALGLRNEDGEYFNDGISVSGQFTVNVGPKVLAVVPQPVTRSANGTLTSAPNVIEVHVDGGDVNVATLEREDLYRLIYTRDTLTSSDDFEMAPTSAVYNSLTKVVRLEFPSALSRVVDPLGNGSTFIKGAARLRIGSSEPIKIMPTQVPINSDPADNFSNALNLNNTWTISSNPNAGIQSARLTSEIRNTSSYGLNLPGEGVPGTRNLRPDDPSRLDRTIPLDVFRRGADSEDGIAVFQYNFVNSWLGDDPTKAGIDETREYFNLITEQQKARVREVLSLFSEYLGVQFVETNGGLTEASSFSIAVGELYGADPRVNSATAIRNPDGTVQTTGPEAVVVATRDRNVDGIDDLVVLDFQDFDQSTDDQLGGEFFRGAFLAVGQLLGYGYADHLPQPVTQSTESVLNPGTDNEPAFPSVADIVNGQFLYRPESNDIDVYQFTLNQPGKVSIETIAERLPSASLLNTALRLYKRDSITGKFTEVAANDDYFSDDSLIELDLERGTYAIGVSASGNTTYDPATPGSGFGGKSEGTYELSLSFRAKEADGIKDNSGNSLDGDLDGNPGGLFNFWFVPNDPNTTLFVDKAATNPDLSRATPNPYLNLKDALAAALPGDTIRVVGNGGVDGDVSTLEDNFAYQIGKDNRGISLADGDSIVVPKGVNLVIDAGAVFKMRRSQVSVGSTAPLVDQSESSLQILGTPTLIGSNGRIITDANGVAIPGSVVFTSFNDNLDPDVPDSASKGDWGGIDFRGDVDSADESRKFLEDEGIFLNHIQYADLRYGGGQVSLNGRQTVISPIDMAVTRPTIINSSISVSADAAMAATPDTFAESRFMTSSASGPVFTPDYSRVGPHIRGNQLDDNTINGLFVRVATRTGGQLQPLTVGARLDDTDIVHVLTENLQITGSAGGLVQTVDAPVSLLIRASSTDTAGEPLEGNMVAGSYRYRMTFATSGGVESDASQPTAAFTLQDDGALQLTGLPTVPASSTFTSRRLYRAPVQADGSDGPYLLVASLNASDTAFIDTALAGSTALSATTGQRTARPDAGLTVDPGTIIKLDGARIDVTFGAHFYAEGTAERPVIMTSLADNRYGAGGTFDTNSTNTTDALSHGDWAGLYVGFGGAASIDHAVIAGGGGISRIPGGFASFNAIEVHQGELRVANSRFEMNDDGREVVNVDDPDRGGRSDNASGTIFVRAAQPVIANNTFIGGYGPVGTFDVNSFSFNEVTDAGRSTGRIDMVRSTGNSGPLIQGNRLAQDEDLPDTVDRFGLNGIEVRGGAVSTEVVLDDVDIVHIVRDTIEIPNQHIYGGMRLESDARGSLVVKFEGATAGIVAGGNLQTSEDQFQDIADRIGGSLQVVGHPDFPVVLTALVDDTIGAGFRPDGSPSVDTDANGIRQSILSSQTTTTATPPGLPVGPEYDRTDREVDNGTRIDNDIDPNVIGFFEGTVTDGNEVTNISVTGIDQATATRLQQQNYGFLETTVVDIDYLTGAGIPLRLADTTFRLSQTTITRPAQLISEDTVISEGTFNMLNNTATDPRPVNWVATTFFLDNRAVMYTTVEFFTPDNRDFGDNIIDNIQVINYLDADVGNGNSDTLYSVGVPGEQDFRAMTINGQNRVGFSHGGIYVNDGTNQFNATYDGWMADDAARLLTAVDTENTNFTVLGDIDQALTAQANDPLFPNATAAFGIGDIGTSFAWTLDSAQDRAKVTSFIEWIPSDPANPFVVQLPLNIEGSGDWDGITIREAAADRNVSITTENEPRNVGVSDTNPTPGQSQFLGELAPNQTSGDENRRLGFIVDGSISQASDIDVYSFIGEAGTQVWLDIDRTDMRLDTIIELIDANGNTLVLSDNSMAESLGTQNRLVAPDGRFPAANARSMNLISANDPNITTQDHQDLFSTNPRDAGMRLILPGEAGQRNLYHVRVRSSSVESGSNQSLVVSGQSAASVPSSLRRGLTSGSYQMQIRLQEVDEHAGTQVRFSDVRFAVNGIQVIGGPIHSPLAGDEYELDTANDTLSAAQRLGLYSVAIDDQNLVDANGNPILDANGNPIAARNNGPLSSDRLSKTIGGVIDSLTDVDWYEFDIKYENLTRDNAALYLATAFDLDYADGLARTDTAIYVFNQAGELVLIGTDSNIADDQPLGSANAEDLSRGSFGTGDPFIGSAELSEGIYYVAVSNQQRVPQPMDQFFDPNSTNPLLRLEPIDSVRRVVEEHFEAIPVSGTASTPQFPVLFDQNSIIDYTFDDVMLYVNTGSGLFLVNPYTGAAYTSSTQGGGFLGNFGDEVRDVAFGSNGELFAYTGFSNRQPADNAWAYYSIDTATAALGTPITVGGGITTHHLSSPPPVIQPGQFADLNVASDDGLEVEAITIREFLNAETGFLVGNRPFPQNGLAYTTNILYGFNENTGLINGGNFNLDRNIPGAGTSRREIGQIDTAAPTGARPLQLGFTAATEVNSAGIATQSLFDGDRFTLTNQVETVTFEFDQGFTLSIDNSPLTNPDGTPGNPRTIPFGDTVLIKLPGQVAKVFEFVSDPANVTGTNIPVVISANLGPEALIERLASAIRGAGVSVSAAGTQLSVPNAETVTIQTNPLTTSTSLVLSGTPGVESGNFRIPLFPTDTAGVVAQRIVNAVDQANAAGDLPNVNAFIDAGASDAHSVRIVGGFIGDPVGSAASLPTGNLTAGGLPTGGTVTGVELVNNNLYAITDTGGLFVVSSGELASAVGNRTVGSYVLSATDLVGINFTGLRAGPASVEDGELRQILFGVTGGGDIYAFNTRGELQPVFAGGRSMISTGIGGALGLDFSILDYNLWHVTERRDTDPGHGVSSNFSDTRQSSIGGNSLAFNFENTAEFRSKYAHPAEVPDGTRLDGTSIVNTYNMPGGAKGEVQSNTFDLSGYAATDLPTLYFSYFLDADDVADINGARDSLRVYIVDANGVEHLVASNSDFRNTGENDDEFDDPSAISLSTGSLYDDDIDVEVQQLFDNTGSWRQARVPLQPFAGQSNLSMRIEFSTAGKTATGTPSIRAVAGKGLVENSQLVVNGEAFAIDLAPAVSAPSGRQLAALYGPDPNAVAVITVDGQQYVLDDGVRPVAADQIRIDLLASQPTGTSLEDLSSSQIASLIADTVDLKRLVPSGAVLATRYLDPDYREVIEYAGQTFILNDGTRPVATNEVSVDLIDPLSNVTLDQLSQLEIAAALSLAAGLPLPEYNVIENFNFSDPSDTPGVTGERNDLLYQATPLPYSGGNATIKGTGRIGTVDALGNPSNLNDVDLVRADVTAGTTIFVDVDLVTNPALNAAVRFFDAKGNELPGFVNQARDTIQVTATQNGPIFIGISGIGNSTYDPRIAGTAQTGQIDSYTVSVNFLSPITARTDGNLIEVDGTATITSSSPSLLPVSGQQVLTGRPIQVSRFDTAPQVAQAISLALADRFSDGDTSFTPTSGAMVRTGALTINDFGPFVNEQLRYGDQFAAGFLAGTADNNHEGVFIDDIIIGFAERGELATNSRAVSPTETFVEDGTRFFTSTPRPTQPTVTGAYQLEIRDASEYVDSEAAEQFRTFDTNDRLTDGYALRTFSGNELIDGATFTVGSAGAAIQFEFDLTNEFGVSDGLNSPNSQIPIVVSESATSNEVGTAIMNALRASAVRQVLGLDANGANGSLNDNRINVYGDVTITDDGTAFDSIEVFGLRGDSNRDRNDQGVIIIENSRFLFNADAGIELNRGAESRVQGVNQADQLPAAIVYPRNLVELNSNDLLPGVVVQSNVLAFNANAGVRITGLGPNGGTQSNPIAFDRILNNTIVGGNVNRPDEAFPDIFNDLLFDKGEISFADTVVSYTAGANVSAGFDNPQKALGAPDVVGRGLEPVDGEFTTSLGRRGVLTVGFTDNYLTGSGDARPDLVIFETGSIEGVSVAVSRDGVNFINVGVVAGIDATIDLDAFGFNAQDRFGFVRLTDLGQGTSTTGAVGADIDAVGALSTVAADIYVPGSQGIVVQQGAAPTLLNNVIANAQTAIAIDDASLQTVIGGTTYYRNATDARSNQTDARGAFAQQINSSQEVFIDPVQLVFTPRAGTPLIDSSIDSLEDRPSLITVRGAIGLPPSPIIAPSFDVNGQLRVDDPDVETPSGIGERVFKDRGAEDRADEVGPRAILVSPRAPDIGLDGGQVVTGRGDIFDAFDIQLIDGIAGADPTPGVGIDDDSVTGDAILVTRDGQTLVEGIDYRFGYDPSNNVIRLTPLAGVWQDNSVYVIRLLDSTDAVLRVQTGSNYSDRALTTVIGLDGSFTTLEADTGINIVVAPSLFGANIDGQSIRVFDGQNEVTFEFDTDGQTSGGFGTASTVAVPVATTLSVSQLTAALADAINASILNLDATALDNQIQLLGDSTLASATPLSDVFTVTVTNTTFTMTSALFGAADGETVTVFDGTNSLTFEFDSDGTQNDPNSVLVPVIVTDSTQQLAEALNTQIQASGLNLTSSVLNNRVVILADSPLANGSTLSDNIRVTNTISGPAIGTAAGFGLRVPNTLANVSDDIADGQTFVIQRGATLVRTFELDSGNGVITPGAIPVVIGANPTLDGIADALVRAIAGAGLGLNPENIGDGRVTLGGDANYAVDLSNTALQLLASAGQNATIPVVIPIDATIQEVAELYQAAIQSIGLPNVTIAIVGDRLIIDGVGTVTGSGAVTQPIIRDDVGNLLQSNTTAGTTELVVFVGGGADYGDAPAPYKSLEADGGPRHNVISNLYLGRGVTPDADAQVPDGDRNDDGIRVNGAVRPGFSTTFLVDINLPSDPSDTTPLQAPGVFYLDAWFDWDGDGVFEESEVKRFGSAGSGRPLVGVGAGNTITVDVPNNAKIGEIYARFRISEDSNLGSLGVATSGEVEDIKLFVSSNPFRNPINRNDVNNNGVVTPLDALQIINSLNRAGASTIRLDQPTPTDLPPFPDTNSDGVVTVSDALNVINELNLNRNTFSGSGEQVNTSTRYVPTADGVYASGATAVGDLLVAEANENAAVRQDPVSSIAAEGESSKASVFDHIAVANLDSIVDSLAADTASATDGEEESSVLDQIFANL